MVRKLWKWVAQVIQTRTSLTTIMTLHGKLRKVVPHCRHRGHTAAPFVYTLWHHNFNTQSSQEIKSKRNTHCVSLSTTYVLYSIVCTQSIGLNQSAMSMFWFSASTTLTYTTHCLHPIENFIVIHRVYTCFCIHTKIHIARSASSRAHTHGMTNNLTLIVVYKQYTVCLYNWVCSGIIMGYRCV